MRQLRLTEQQLSAMKAKTPVKGGYYGVKVNKYHAKKTIVDGIEFDSRKEAKRWQELRLLESAGRITDLHRQRPYELRIGSHHVCTYVADFVYHEAGKVVVEDCKGMKKGAAYAMFRLKAKLMLACYGIEISEV